MFRCFNSFILWWCYKKQWNVRIMLNFILQCLCSALFNGLWFWLWAWSWQTICKRSWNSNSQKMFLSPIARRESNPWTTKTQMDSKGDKYVVVGLTTVLPNFSCAGMYSFYCFNAYRRHCIRYHSKSSRNSKVEFLSILTSLRARNNREAGSDINWDRTSTETGLKQRYLSSAIAT